ncbi:MAG: CBM9 family sugar-binding protein [Oscillospiraceae bacterium]|nr:CBM9 family sugar-binding protein [Oscillospiraceae bacterium]
MKKISFFIILALIFSAFAIPAISAADPDDTYLAAKLYYPVKADGKIDGNEWDDAYELVLTTENEVMNAFGRYQGGDPDFFKNTKVTYKIKWDENNLYILEIREDTDAWVFEPDNATAPWRGNGTLFFISYDNNPKWANAYEVFWTAKAGDGKAKVALRAFHNGRDGSFEGSDDAEWIGNWQFAGIVTGTNSVFEIIIPWTDIQKFNTDIGMPSTMKIGEKFKFTPIVPKHKEDGSTGQMNYHDKYDRPDAVTDENSNPGELPVNWANLLLVDSIVQIIIEEEYVEEAGATTSTPAAQAPTSPVTFDNTMIIIAIIIFATGAVVITRRSIKLK